MESFGADEDSERLKAWLQHNGSYVLYALIFGLALAFGIRYWRGHEERMHLAAASLYSETLDWYQSGDGASVALATDKLEHHYAASPYAPLAALLDAKMAYKAKDLKKAASALTWAADHAHAQGIVAIARLRLSRVLLEEGQLAQALAAVDRAPPAGFVAPYQEARGDILLAEGHPRRAQGAYQAALAQVSSTSRAAGVLHMKLDDLKSGPT